jgi:hypothetical protein
MFLGLTASIAWAAWAVVARANTVDLNSVADAFLSSANATSNYGGAGGLSIAASGLPKGEFQSVLRFDASAAKSSFDAAFGAGQWSIQEVGLKLTAANPLNAIFNSQAAGQFSASWMQNDSWVEGTGKPSSPGTTGITFGTLPSFLSAGDSTLGTFSFNGSTSGTFTYSLTPDAGFLTDLSGGNLVSLRLLAADSLVAYVSNAREFATVANRPTLSVTAMALPEPGAVVLLLAGACALFGLKIGKRRTQ